MLFATNESSAQTVAVRLLAAEAAVEGIRLRDGRLRNCDWDALGRSVDATELLALHVIDGVNTVDQLRQAAHSTTTELGTLGLIIVDRVDPLLRHSSMSAIIELAGDLSVPLVTTGSAPLLAGGDESTSGARIHPARVSRHVTSQSDCVVRERQPPISRRSTLNSSKNRFGPTAVIQVLMRTSVPLLLNRTQMEDPGVQVDDTAGAGSDNQ